MCTVHESLKKNYFNKSVIKIIHTCFSLSLSLISEHLSQAHSLTSVSHSLNSDLTPVSQAFDQPQTHAADWSACSWILGTWLGNPWSSPTHPFCWPSSPAWLECLLVVGFLFFFFCCCGLVVVVVVLVLVVVVAVVVAVAEEKIGDLSFFFFLSGGGGGGGCGYGWGKRLEILVFFFSSYCGLVVVVVVVVLVVVVVVVVVVAVVDGRGGCGWCCGCFFG